MEAFFFFFPSQNSLQTIFLKIPTYTTLRKLVSRIYSNGYRFPLTCFGTLVG